MNRRKTIYRGFNKRRKRNEWKIIVVVVSICMIGGYGYLKLKDSTIFTSITKKVSAFNIGDNVKKLIPGKDKVEEFDYNDVSDEVDKLQKEDSNTEENKDKKEEGVNTAIIDGWDMYSVQVASVQNKSDLNKVKSSLEENKIPFSVVVIDGASKVQTYGSFDKEMARNHLEEIRVLYPDAFLSQVKIPVLSLEYTNKYSYVNDISKELNSLIANLKEESEFWAKSQENPDLNEYNKILTTRKTIINELESQANKIDYSEMKGFKENLIKYAKDVDSKIDEASKAANEQRFYVSEGLFLSSMQGYLEFINSMKKA
ncbi:MAG: hypothetical protein ACRDA3_01835 [Peptostreptococcaceae bacterium]